ncbi:MAG: PAS domain-containing protein [Hymenobacter sp.]
MEQMSEGAVLLGAAGEVLYANAALATALGRPSDKLLGHPFTEFVPAGYLAYWTGLWAQGWAGQARGEMPLQHCLTGSLRPFSVSMNVLTLSGAPTLAVLLADGSRRPGDFGYPPGSGPQHELLDRKNEELARQRAARQAVEQTAAEVSRVLEGIPQIAWTADPQGRTTYFNRRWFDYVG